MFCSALSLQARKPSLERGSHPPQHSTAPKGKPLASLRAAPTSQRPLLPVHSRYQAEALLSRTGGADPQEMWADGCTLHTFLFQRLGNVVLCTSGSGCSSACLPHMGQSWLHTPSNCCGQDIWGRKQGDRCVWGSPAFRLEPGGRPLVRGDHSKQVVGAPPTDPYTCLPMEMLPFYSKATQAASSMQPSPTANSPTVIPCPVIYERGG